MVDQRHKRMFLYLADTNSVSNSAQEYGTGRFNKKHSTFFATMMRELDLNEEPEFYFDLLPWQSLASMNHNFLLTERRRHYLRYAGGLTFFEVHPLQSVCCMHVFQQ